MKLVSEGLKKDGSFQLLIALESANDRLEQLGKRGKRAKLKRSGNSVAVQFSFNKTQQQKGINCNFTFRGISEAEKIAGLITSQLSANTFTWEWFNSLIGKEIESEDSNSKTCHELIAEYKTYWLKENRKLKDPTGFWYRRFHHLEKVMVDLKTELSPTIIKQIIDRSENNTATRTYILQALTLVLDHFGISDHDRLINSYKTKNNPSIKKRRVPTDSKIKAIFHTGFDVLTKCPRIYRHRYQQWQFFYGLVATYGLRIHEAWNIANWDKPVTLDRDDWIVVEESLDNDRDKYEQTLDNRLIVPAILDPANTEKILCIKHATKTGYRMAMPLSPSGEDWLREFDLIQPFNLPDIENPLDKNNVGQALRCSKFACDWFLKRKYGFTPHDLRHAYNHRGHCLGYNPTLLSKSLGHSLQMNSTTYLKTMPDTRTLQMFLETSQQEKEKQSEVERLKAEVEFLSSELEKLRTENSLYKSLLEQVRSR
jgi:integrase